MIHTNIEKLDVTESAKTAQAMEIDGWPIRLTMMAET